MDIYETPGYFLFLNFDYVWCEDTMFIFTCENFDVVMVTDKYNFSFNIIKVEFDFFSTKNNIF